MAAANARQHRALPEEAKIHIGESASVRGLVEQKTVSSFH
jgi:hypothetical protein